MGPIHIRRRRGNDDHDHHQWGNKSKELEMKGSIVPVGRGERKESMASKGEKSLQN